MSWPVFVYIEGDYINVADIRIFHDARKGIVAEDVDGVRMVYKQTTEQDIAEAIRKAIAATARMVAKAEAEGIDEYHAEQRERRAKEQPGT